MPTIVDKWMEKGELKDKRSILTKLMLKKFNITEKERVLINQVEDFKKLDRAFDIILSADNKEQVFHCLR